MAFNIRSILGRNNPQGTPTPASLPRLTPTGNPDIDTRAAKSAIENSGMSMGDYKRGINPAGGQLTVDQWDRRAGFIHPDQPAKKGMIKPSDMEMRQKVEKVQARRENRPARDMRVYKDIGRPQGAS